MRIGIDARSLAGQRTGIGTYLHELLIEFANIGFEHEFVLYSNRPILLDFSLPNNWKIVIDPAPLGTLWLLVVLPRLIARDCINSFWGPSQVLPFLNGKVKTVLTVHDLALIVLPEVGTFYNRLIAKFLWKKSCIFADTIIADSASTKKDIESLFNIDAIKIIVAYLGVRDDPQIDIISNAELDSIFNRRFNSMSYFLFLGTIEPRKNVDLIIDAYNEYRKCQIGNQLLVLAGRFGWKYSNIVQKLSQSPYRRDIIILGYIPEAIKKQLLRSAVAFLFPSKYEGFGLPILEAFAQGTPVITLRNSSLPEVGGECAYYLEKEEGVIGLAKLMTNVANFSTKERLTLGEECKRQKNKFSWSNSAKSILNCLTSRYD